VRPGPAARPIAVTADRAQLALAVNLITHPPLWWLALNFDRPQQLIMAELGWRWSKGR
jgi:hypothetical protein